jgi:cytochrome P450
VPYLARRTLTDTEVLGYYSPAGTLVSITTAGSHFAPEYWTDPYSFDPERFDEPRREDRSHRYAWMPFGGGAHKCIGLHFGVLEVKALLHEMLRAYRWAIPENYRTRWDYTSLPVPVDGLPITLARHGGSGSQSAS